MTEPTRPLNRADTVTPGVRIAADWSWRLLVILAGIAVLGYLVAILSEVTIPVALALLLSALLNPVKRFLVAKGWSNSWAAVAVFLGGLIVVIGIITVVVQQFASGASDLANRAGGGIDKVKEWLINGPFHISQAQIDSSLDSAKQWITDHKDSLTSGALGAATTAGHVLTGLVLALFTLFFFLRDGRKIWSWLLGLLPSKARTRTDGAALRGWHTLGGYVRAAVLVALVDAVGIGVVLVIVGVPLAFPLAAFVFLSSFIPIVGALLSGIVAVLVALVAVGPGGALIVLAGVIAVQQLEAHVLQPILLGRGVNLHPLAVVLSLAVGAMTAGIIGAVLAVPLAASLNSAIGFLAGKGREWDGSDRIERGLEAREATARVRLRKPGRAG